MTWSVMSQAIGLVFDPYVLWVILASSLFGLFVAGTMLLVQAWLRRNRREPFFLWAHYLDPHAPYDAPTTPKEVRKRRLDCFVHTVPRPIEGFATDHEVLEELRELGFKTAPESRLFSGMEDVIAYCDSWQSHRHDLPYDIDGMVVKVDLATFTEVDALFNVDLSDPAITKMDAILARVAAQVVYRYSEPSFSSQRTPRQSRKRSLPSRSLLIITGSQISASSVRPLKPSGSTPMIW